MARKVVFDRERIIEKAFKMLKKEGMEAITARKLGDYMNASPAPIYNSFRSMEELKEVLVEKAKALFLDYIQNNRTELPFLNMGLGFCIFAKEESNLFRNIFLNPNIEGNIIEQFREISQQEIIKDSRFDNISEDRRTEIFFDCWTYAQGLASFIALGQIAATEAELIDMLLRGPGYLIHKKLEEYGKQ
ncbi:MULTISPECIES: TetR/AcrR family transcriptional regulator [Fusobacterium]|uniref:Transcriptional regulator, TetR family n=1 Tax=Fusobacterium equinum TaxID=134605 RepID=A0A133NKA3_9FUSO|nr:MULTISPECIES: TetR/AcrR family transcriptional regulator [Fusobacterium]AVQ17329.1 TetR/AcrR family transcriptional regulator [Fusobacterium gonidiaformans ATCC 25563]EFS27898.1 hypothetical protein FGAG_00219 [Fusobacterium gonidiaformans ATCC 25563]KXA16714.1 transcriptional regulator, TetR family [Fusobacterium equinum]